MKDRILPLAGLVQGLRQIRRIAETGQAEASVLNTALHSIFELEPDSIADVYGGLPAIRPGLLLLRDYLASQGQDPQLPKLAMSVMQIERRYSAERDMDDKVHVGIMKAKRLAERHANPSHPEVLAALGGLYAETISHLRPKVMVQGNPHYLGQAPLVAEIRAILLASLRSAVLWRQLGGSYWDFAFRRRAMQQAIQAQLEA